MPRIRFIASVVAVATAVLGLASCGNDKSDGAPVASPGATRATTSPSTAAASPTDVRLAFISGGAVALYPQFAIADAEGFFKKRALNVNRIETQTSGDAGRLLASGDADVAVLTPDVAVQLAVKGGKIRVLASTSDEPTWFLIGKKGMSGPQDLSGRRLGVPQLTGTATFLSRVGLAAAGLANDDYELIVTGQANNRLAALSNGAVDATVLPAPLNFKVEDQGFARLQYLGEKVKVPGAVVAVSESFLDNQRSAAVRVIRALQDARQWLYEPANRDAFVALVQRYPEGKGLDPALLAKTYDEFVKTRQIHPETGEVDLGPLVADMRKFGELDGNVDLAALVDTKVVAEAAGLR